MTLLLLMLRLLIDTHILFGLHFLLHTLKRYSACMQVKVQA
nr:MAG TPA: hypothetical protein [Bacteriophage sp.]DAX86540.1 MAG TPA: hypothetical protein [Caudoviricetes sp.]